MSLQPSVAKLHGFAHLVAAARYSTGGLLRLWQESAFRQEILAGLGLIAAYALMDVAPAVRLSACVLYLLLIAVEALNTAIEVIVDRISPEVSEMARHAKDLGSLAVFCLIASNSLLLLYALASSW